MTSFKPWAVMASLGCVTLLCGLVGGTNAGAGQAESWLTWTNPIVPQRADPHVFRHTDGYYYLAATVPRYDCIELRRSQTIGGLATAAPKVVWRRPAQGAMAGPIWAPEIHFIQGKWYVYYSAGEGGKPWDRIRMFVMENESANPLEGEWTVKGQIKSKWDSFSLDATTFEHQGERYYVWTQVEPGKQGSCIMIAKMESPTALAEEQVILSRPDLPWEQRVHWVNEAPAALVRHGKVFIAYSASATDHNYCMGLLTADADANLLDPKSWTKSPEPVFASTDATSQYGPGHNSFTTTPDGKTDILVYHSRNFKEIPGGNALANPDRATRAQVLRWKPDGTPDFGVPVADGPYRVPTATP
jgi:GH43 family beta-xylosidase